MSSLMNKVQMSLILQLAFGMVSVYPVHIIIDHAGLFGHHHEHGHNHPNEPTDEEDLCLFCVNLGAMDHSEALLIWPVVSESDGFSDENQSLQIGDRLTVGARAPPLATIFNT